MNVCGCVVDTSLGVWRQHIPNEAAMLQVLQQLTCGGVQSETYQSARSKRFDGIADWIDQWLETGEFWPDEAFNYGCP